MLIKKTVYLREDDLELWAACPNKSLLVHNALNGSENISVPRVENEKIAVAAFNDETCPGHKMRMNCGLKGCKYV